MLPADGVVVGRLVDFDADGSPRVEFPGNDARRPLPAVATRRFDEADRGCAVALLFVGGDPHRPLIVGPLVDPGSPPTPAASATPAPLAAGVTVDGGVTTVTAQQQLVLRCGAASITLTRAGKVLIRGTYLLSRSSGVNRIKGGSIQLN
ncbi:MAG: hypothetical protein IH621_15700 [Krumholzibacteria bacterium]|nr:hypothetical protein [Candidatus Krumholzibacteria bacterium]